MVVPSKLATASSKLPVVRLAIISCRPPLSSRRFVAGLYQTFPKTSFLCPKPSK
jgi:hypothetical protein